MSIRQTYEREKPEISLDSFDSAFQKAGERAKFIQSGVRRTVTNTRPLKTNKVLY